MPEPESSAGYRAIRFAGAAVGVAWDGEETAAIVERLFADLPADADERPPSATLRLESPSPGGRYRLLLDEGEKWSGESIGGLASRLLDETLRLLADGSRDGLVLHAAAVSRGDRTLLLPGASGAGKTSLCAWLLRRGYRYLTDELVFIDAETASAHCFPRPLNVKKRGAGVVRELLPREPLEDETLATPFGVLIPHRLLNPDYRFEPSRIALILMPHFTPGARFSLQPRSRAQVAQRLMECLINARNLRDHGFAAAIGLAQVAEGWALDYGGYDQLGDDLLELLDRHLGA